MFSRLALLTLALTTISILTQVGCGDDDPGEPTAIVQVVITPDSADVQAGDTIRFTATALDQNGDPVPSAVISWSSSNPVVAAINQEGLATGITMGTTEIEAEAARVPGTAILVVLPNSNADPPDDSFLDTNGDGIDGDIAKAVFVATSGSDANPGTPDQPKLTITAAIAAAVADASKTEIYVSTGTYPETVELANGVSIYGGYDAGDDWSRSFTSPAIVQGDTIAILGQSITQSTVVDLLIAVSADNTQPGGNSTGIYLASSSAVTLRNLDVTAGNGGSGAAGTAGVVGATGNDGQPGSRPVGGLGGDPVPGTPDSGKGGDGGNGADVFPAAGGDGGDGLPQPGGGTGGVGGPDPAAGDPDACEISGLPGDPGSPGADGVAGTAGAGGDGQGSVASGYWSGSPGAAGTVGAPGFGGGAGGGGSAGRLLTAAMICQPLSGGGGGGGGSGGQGGEPGTGGGGGGGSFGLLVIDSNVDIVASEITAGDGGAGGTGGDGGPGGPGGNGGVGAAGEPNQAGTLFGGDGSDGASGGAGGAGGPGGGGGGGVSYAVYRSGSSIVQIDASSTLIAGTGGAGGTAPAGGNAGSDGASGDKNFSS